MSRTSIGSGSGIFYGWFVVAAAFTVTLLGFGSAYTFSAFFESLQREFSASRGTTSLVFSLAGFLYFGIGVISGPLADRIGSRALAVTGMALLGAGLVLAGSARSLTEFYLAYGLGVGLGIGLSYVPVLGAVQRWFARQRGLASGIAVSGIGVGTLVMPPFASWLIDLSGWRASYLLLGGLAAVIGAGMSFLIVDDPRDRGLAPDGDPVGPRLNPDPTHGASIGEAIRSPRFVALYAACLLCSFGVFVPFAHLVPYALDLGVPQSSAVLILGAIGVGSIAGRFLLGGLADRFGRQASLLAMFAGMALAMAIWALSTQAWQLGIFALVYGLFYGGWVALLPAVVMDDFGGRNVSGIIGILYTSVAFGTLAGPSAAGFAFDLTQSYALPILASVCANIVSASIVAVAYRSSMVRRRRPSGCPGVQPRPAPPVARYHRGRGEGSISNPGLSLSVRDRRGAGQCAAPRHGDAIRGRRGVQASDDRSPPSGAGGSTRDALEGCGLPSPAGEPGLETTSRETDSMMTRQPIVG